MLSRFIMVLSCLTSLQVSAVSNEDQVQQKSATTAFSLEIIVPNILATLPTTAPTTPQAQTTPQEKNPIFRVKTYDSLTVSIPALKELWRMEKIAQMTRYLEEAKKKSFLKKLHMVIYKKEVDAKNREIAHYLQNLKTTNPQAYSDHVKASNNSGYFPHSNYAPDSFSDSCNNAIALSGSHMDW